MEPCHKIGPWLEWLAAEEIGARERQRVEAHLRGCPSCRRELLRWQALLAAAGKRLAGAEAECRAIDWDNLAEKIMQKIDGTEKIVVMPARRRIFHFGLLASAASLLVLFGTMLFFLTRSRTATPSGPDDGMISAASVTHLQSGMAREDVLSYLRQSQLMLTDLLMDCAGEETATREIRLYSQKARELLLKKKYFQQNLSALEWIKVRNISERIDWMNYEILQLENRHLCSQIGRLQRIMEDDKLLLKIRLLERELSFQPYQEV